MMMTRKFRKAALPLVAALCMAPATASAYEESGTTTPIPNGARLSLKGLIVGESTLQDLKRVDIKGSLPTENKLSDDLVVLDVGMRPMLCQYIVEKNILEYLNCMYPKIVPNDKTSDPDASYELMKSAFSSKFNHVGGTIRSNKVVNGKKVLSQLTVWLDQSGAMLSVNNTTEAPDMGRLQFISKKIMKRAEEKMAKDF